jgi:hypothetical protein
MEDTPRVDDLALRHPWLASAEAFTVFVQRFEEGRLSRAEWTHGAHVAIGACYVVRYGAVAVDALREGIRRHNAAVGTIDTETSGYHETLTRLWAEVVARAVAGVGDPFAAARLAVGRFGEDRGLPARYYSFDVVKDRRARAEWVAPDLVLL